MSIYSRFNHRNTISVLRSRFLGCHATQRGALRDIPKNGCEGDYNTIACVQFDSEVFE